MAEEGQVIGVHSVGEFDAHVQRGKESKKLIVVDFTASWCPPCRFIAPLFAEFAKKFPNVIFLKLDVDEVNAIPERFQVNAMPTFIFLKDGVEIPPHRIVGADKAGLEKNISLLATEASAA